MKRLIRLPEVSSTVGLSRSKVRQMVRDGEFPKPIRLTENTVAWDADLVQRWISERLAAAQPGPTKPERAQRGAAPARAAA